MMGVLSNFNRTTLLAGFIMAVLLVLAGLLLYFNDSSPQDSSAGLTSGRSITPTLPSASYRQSGPVNIALHKKVRVSRTDASSSPLHAVDGNVDTIWNSGGPRKQWIEIDLNSPHTIRGIELVVSQSTEGHTTHSIYGRESLSASWKLLQIIRGITADAQLLRTGKLEPSGQYRFVRIGTEESSGHAAWREIRIYSDKEQEVLRSYQQKP